MKGSAFLIPLAACALTIASAARVSRERPPEAHTGGFGEPTCMECHAGEALNDSIGRLEVVGLPATYQPGQSYPLTVRLRRQDLSVGGFQLAIRDSVTSKQSGTLTVNNERSMVSVAAGIQYAHHTLSGTGVARGVLEWQVTWRAPAQPGSLMLHATANASNDDASPLGDHIYAIVLRTAGAAGPSQPTSATLNTSKR